MSQASPSAVRVRWPLVALTAISLIWAGMVMGISFLETPIKFTAPSLKQLVEPEIGRAVALDIGRVVFGAFNKVEIVWSVLTFLLLFAGRPFARTPRPVLVLLGLLWAIVAFQSVVLVPALAARAQMVVNSQPLPPAPYHALYSTTEMVKLLSLLVLGVLLIRKTAELQPGVALADAGDQQR